MAIKPNELRPLGETELQKKLLELEKELMIENTQVKAGGRAPNPGKLKVLKKSIAIVKTIIHEKKLNIKREIKQPVVKKEVEKKQTVNDKKEEPKKQQEDKKEVDEKNA